MNKHNHQQLKAMRMSLIAGTVFVVSLALLASCNETESSKTATSSSNSNGSTNKTENSASRVTAGTSLPVTLGTAISSKTAHSGDSWHGTISDNVTTANGVVIPRGSQVSGVVVNAVEAKRGDRAMLDIAVRSVEVGGKSTSINARTEPVIAGSPRARNLGAIAGGAAAGALIGKAVGDGKNSAVGGIIGGATAAGVVATSKGFQVELKEGTPLMFTVNETVSMR